MMTKRRKTLLSLATLGCVGVGIVATAGCAASGERGSTPAHTHTLVSTARVAATCEEDGNGAYWTCEGCGKYFGNDSATTEIKKDSWILPATGHHLTEIAAVEATCTAAGNSAYYTCNDCGTYFSDANGNDKIVKDSWVIAATGHHLTERSATAATCTTAGCIAHWACKDCDAYFADANGATALTESECVIPATGHDWSFANVWTWSTDYTEATARFVCTTDGAHVLEAEATITFTTNATCTTAGEKTYTATVVMDGQTYTDTRTAQVDFSHDVVKTAAQAPTCTETGNSDYWTCRDCGKYFSNAAATVEVEEDSWILPATGHSLTKTAATAAGCNSTGNKAYYTCDRCGKYYSDEAASVEIEEGSWVLAATGHTLVKTTAVSPTCQAYGNSAYWTCTTCGEYYADEEGTQAIAANDWVLSPVAHNYIDGVCEWCDDELSGNFTNTETAVYDETVGKYILPETATDESGNTYDRYILTPSAADADNEYTVSGEIANGHIYMNDETDTYTVVLNLNGATIRCAYDSPLYFLSADKVEVSAKKGTQNYIYDERANIASDATTTDTYGKGAIFAKCDLKLKGNGALTVVGNHNDGVHTTKDLTIKNLTLSVTAYNNGIKGEDSLTVESGTISVLSTAGDGLKTSHSDLSASGKQRGTITITGGTIDIYACFDGLDACFDVNISGDPILTIYTWKYAYAQNGAIDTSLNSTSSSSSSSSSGSTGSTGSTGGFGGMGGNRPGSQGQGGMAEGGNSNQTTYSCKGIVANNQIQIDGGTITIYANDDAIHTNNDGIIDNTAVTPQGDLYVTGGTLLLTSDDDAMHADNILGVSGGDITILSSYEGIEGETINISGGDISVYSTDDGLNASMDDASPKITISGGTLNVTVSGGDVDGIDSNGTYTQTGGVVTVCVPSNSATSGGLDVDSTVSISGGTFVIANSSSNSSSYPSSSLKSKTLSGTFSGTYSVVSGSETLFTFTLGASYSSLYILSSSFTSGSSYTLQTSSGSSVASWTQS